MTDNTTTLLAERAKTHGSFMDNAELSQGMKNVWRSGRNWQSLTDAQREAFEMIATKMSRILSGNNNEPDHWADIAGYSRLVEKSIHENNTRDYSKGNRDLLRFQREEFNNPS
jgi:hypothetical protein